MKVILILLSVASSYCRFDHLRQKSYYNHFDTENKMPLKKQQRRSNGGSHGRSNHVVEATFLNEKIKNLHTVFQRISQFLLKNAF